MTARFVTELELKDADNKDDGQWVVAFPLVYKSDIFGDYIEVPVGFQTDLASIPRIPLVYEALGGHANAAAVVHDYLYSSHRTSRSMADDILHEACLATGVSSWRAWAIWAGVRIGGAAFWDKAFDSKTTDGASAKGAATDGGYRISEDHTGG